MDHELFFPHLESCREHLVGSTICQLRRPTGKTRGVLARFQRRGIEVFEFTPEGETRLPAQILIVPKKTQAAWLTHCILPNPASPVPECNGDGARWLRPHPRALADHLGACEEECRFIVRSWRGQFVLLEERREGNRAIIAGLRPHSSARFTRPWPRARPSKRRAANAASAKPATTAGSTAPAFDPTRGKGAALPPLPYPRKAL